MFDLQKNQLLRSHYNLRICGGGQQNETGIDIKIHDRGRGFSHDIGDSVGSCHPREYYRVSFPRVPYR